MIKFENVTKNFKDKKVLRNITLDINKGNLVAFIGESGCGKTTTLKMINRLIRPSSGNIYINGENIESRDIIELRRQMGYVIQQTGLFPHMTVKDNIEIIPKAEKRDKSVIEKRTYELMEMVGLKPEEYLHRYPVELSGGQQQRVGVARAFATDPEIILMDEPFSALDPITRIGLQDELINLQSHLRKTIVFVTHDMDEAIKIADMICIMRNGEILQYDTPENILKNPCNDFVSKFVGKNRIWTSPEFIKAEDIMITSPVTCMQNMTLLRCMDKMRSNKVDSLMIIENTTNHLIGTISAQQIQQQSDRAREVNSIMSTDFLSVSPQDNIIDILKLVEENQVSNIPVIDEDNTLLGLITKSSLVTTLSQQYLEVEGV
ncbi:betaine/proline/choline family ABC transporter ATP-binding protein [Anaerocolumna sedimenticola]|uniref:Quaternary amine transport ATP-binding protein n=1 Tax=Anaerocolumna sedimenticola TaxID=2696063 RepID=A0A6P1TPC0_9FIRM|nr:ABC transporter ATP-binding protein [Anaerocolumna sedimenticola]QHQ62032.1 betaine/proline/choline family ABC transporter ATP-binding protein [Anaerocolumna sedimenticola]